MRRRLRVLITRTRHQASALAAKLEALGAEIVLVPTIELAPPSTYAALDAAIDALGDPPHDVAWLLFTSANAVHAFSERRRAKGIEVYPQRIAVIGPATLKAVQEAGISAQDGPVLVPGQYTAESLAANLLSFAGAEAARFLLVRAEEARDVIPAALEGAGHTVTIAAAYRNIMPPDSIVALRRLFATTQAYPDLITFTSSSTARNLFALLTAAEIVLPADVTLVSIGPVTSATLRELGHEPDLEAVEPTIDSLVAAIAARL